MTSSIGNSSYTPPINPATNQPYTAAELQAIVDTLAPVARGAAPNVFSSSGKILSQVPQDSATDLPIIDYVSTLVNAKLALKQALIALESISPALQTQYAIAAFQNIQSLLALKQNIFNFDNIYADTAADTNTTINQLNALNSTYNTAASTVNTAYNNLKIIIQNYNNDYAAGKDTTTDLANYQIALATYTSVYNANYNSVFVNYNTQVTTTYGPNNPLVSELSDFNNLAATTNGLAGSSIAPTIPSPLNGLNTYTIPPPTTSTPNGHITLGPLTVNGQTVSSLPTISTIPAVTATTSGDYTNATSNLQLIITAQQNVNNSSILLNANTFSNQNNLLNGTSFSDTLPNAYIQQGTRSSTAVHPTAFNTLNVNDANQTIAVTQFIVQSLLNYNIFATSHNLNIKDSASKLADLLLKTIDITALTSGIKTIQDNPNLQGQEGAAVDLTLLSTYVNQLIEDFSGTGNDQEIQTLIQKAFPELTGTDLQNAAQSIKGLLQVYALLAATLAISSVLNIPLSQILQNIEGVSADSLIAALQGNKNTLTSVINDPYKQTLLLANLSQINGPLSLTTQGTTTTTLEDTQNALQTSLTTIANNPNITLATAESAFTDNGFQQDDAKTLAQETLLFLNNEVSNPNLDTKVAVRGLANPDLVTSFLDQYPEQQSTQIGTALNYTLQTNPQSLRSFSIDLENRLINTGSSPLEALTIANNAASTFQPPTSNFQSALNTGNPANLPNLAQFNGINLNQLVTQSVNSLVTDNTQKPFLAEALTDALSSAIKGLTNAFAETPQQTAYLDAIKTFTTPNFELTQTTLNSISAAANFTAMALGVPNIGQPVKASTDAQFGIGLPSSRI